MSDEQERIKSTHLTERLRSITIGNYGLDAGSHWKNIPVAPVCREAADEIERLQSLCDDLWSSIIAAMMLTPRNGGAYKLLRNTVEKNRERWSRV